MVDRRPLMTCDFPASGCPMKITFTWLGTSTCLSSAEELGWSQFCESTSRK